MGAYTRVDVLFQAYLWPSSSMATMGAPQNPGNPYATARRSKMASALLADRTSPPVSVRSLGPALNSVWYQKWLVHLASPSESGGAIVRQILTGLWQHAAWATSTITSSIPSAVQASFDKFGDYFLAMAYPKALLPIRPIRPATALSPVRASPS